MSRGSRVFRGACFAVFATVIAAVSHMLVGGNAPALSALAATSVAVLPLCVALAGREGSLWRTTLAVSASQALFHWSFGSIGAPALERGALTGSGFAEGTGLSPHAQHLGMLGSFTPSVDALGSSGLMFAAHACAALLTVAMLRRGEDAVRAIRGACAAGARRLSPASPTLASIPSASRLSVESLYVPIRPLATARASMSLRGPPAWERCSA